MRFLWWWFQEWRLSRDLRAEPVWTSYRGPLWRVRDAWHSAEWRRLQRALYGQRRGS